MTWNPSENAWESYLKFEERLGGIENCRGVLEKFIDAKPFVNSYLKAAKFEEKHKNREGARHYFERALAELGNAVFDENFFIQFTNFEIKCRNAERARMLFKYGLDNIPKEKAGRLYSNFLYFEKQHGLTSEMEELILTKRRHQLE